MHIKHRISTLLIIWRYLPLRLRVVSQMCETQSIQLKEQNQLEVSRQSITGGRLEKNTKLSMQCLKRWSKTLSLSCPSCASSFLVKSGVLKSWNVDQQININTILQCVMKNTHWIAVNEKNRINGRQESRCIKSLIQELRCESVCPLTLFSKIYVGL